MTVWGVTDTGFKLKRLEDIKLEIEDDFRVSFGQTVDLSSDNPLGQIIAIVSARRADDWLAMQAVYNSFFASLASGISLDRVNQIRGVARRLESFSIGFVTFTGTPDVQVLQGARVQDATGKQVQTLVTAATDSTTGVVIVPVRAVSPGPVVFISGTLTTLVTSIFGINSVTNAANVSGGLFRETDENFRLRSIGALTNPGTSNIEGIRNAVENVEFVINALVTENSTNTTDGDGRPPHSFETYLLTSLSGPITDFPDTLILVGEAIWNAKPAGIQTHGDTEAEITDSQGFTHSVFLTEATKTTIVVVINIVPNMDSGEGELFPLNGADLVKEAILAYGATLTMGRDVWINRVFAAASSVPGVKGVTALTLNAGTVNIAINPVELPVFAAASITVNVA